MRFSLGPFVSLSFGGAKARLADGPLRPQSTLNCALVLVLTRRVPEPHRPAFFSRSLADQPPQGLLFVTSFIDGLVQRQCWPITARH